MSRIETDLSQPQSLLLSRISPDRMTVMGINILGGFIEDVLIITVVSLYCID